MTTAAPPEKMMLDAMIDEVIREVAELPDRTSPEDWPEAMLVTADELRSILREAARRLAPRDVAVREALNLFRYAKAFAAAEAWDGGPDMVKRFDHVSAISDALLGPLTNDEIAHIGRALSAPPAASAEREDDALKT